MIFQFLTPLTEKNPFWSNRKETILFWVILFGLLLRLPSVTVPILDANAWKQADQAAMARNFYENGLNILYPRIDWRGASNGNFESEFPAYTFMVAVLY